VPELLEGLARVAVAEDQPERALCLAGAAAALRRDAGPEPSLRQARDAAAASARAVLDAETAAVAWATGAAMTQEEALAEAGCGLDVPVEDVVLPV
jgi:hypothetical protein